MFRYRAPQGALAPFVSLLWLQESENAAVWQERLLPDGAMELVIDLRSDSIPLFDSDMRRQGSAAGSVFCGAHSQSFGIERSRDECVVGVHFRPGGAFPFFDVPIRELTNSVVALEDLWKGRAAELRERLIAAPTHDERFDTLESFLIERAVRPMQRRPVVDFALQQWEKLPHGTVGEVAAQGNLSARRFIQVFRDEVGLSPKLFCRIQRFQSVLERLSQDGVKNEVGWLDVALESGHFDQAHFIREFRAFSGLTPTAYREQMGAKLNLVGIPV